MITLLILRGCMHFNGFLSETGFCGFELIPSPGNAHYDSLNGKFSSLSLSVWRLNRRQELASFTRLCSRMIIKKLKKLLSVRGGS